MPQAMFSDSWSRDYILYSYLQPKKSKWMSDLDLKKKIVSNSPDIYLLEFRTKYNQPIY